MSDVDIFYTEQEKSHALLEDLAQTTSNSRLEAAHLLDEACALDRRYSELLACETALPCMSEAWGKALIRCRREAHGSLPTVEALCAAATTQIVADLLRNDSYITQVQRLAGTVALGSAAQHTGLSKLSKQGLPKGILSICGPARTWDEELSAVSTADMDDGESSQWWGASSASVCA